MILTERRLKETAEILSFSFEFAPELAVGDALTGIPTITSSPTGLSIGGGTIDGTQVVVQIGAGVSGGTYTVICSASTTGGNRHEIGMLLDVQDIVPWAAPPPATSLLALIPNLDIEIGRGSFPEAELTTFLLAGVRKANARLPAQFGLTGTTLSRAPSAIEAELIVLFSVIAWLDGESVKQSSNAITLSNPAGRTDLRGVEFALAKRKKELLQDQIAALLKELEDGGIIAEVAANELGETKELTGRLPYFWYPWNGWP